MLQTTQQKTRNKGSVLLSLLFATALSFSMQSHAADPSITRGDQADKVVRIAPASGDAQSDHAEIHWSYEGDGGPDNWGRIKGEYKECRVGQYQSPIDIKPTVNGDLPLLNVDYNPAPLKILNNGHTVQVNYESGSTMKVGDDVFRLLQFHFHTPSEHMIDGQPYEMELHFVHATDDGRLGVLGVMIEEGEHNQAAEKIWANLPMREMTEKTYSNVSINGSDLLPPSRSYFRLMGSLTTPPCTEGVNWHVMTMPIQFSRTQIDKFKQAFSMNARPVQPRNSRLIVMDR